MKNEKNPFTVNLIFVFFLFVYENVVCAGATLTCNTELSSENTWVPMLVVVALVSAMLGAVLMITALKCRR